jgi:hypothetical protein
VGTTLANCTVVGNWAYYRGGGVDSCTLWNSIVVSNSVVNSPDSLDWFGGDLNYCCTTPLPGTGVGNMTNAPLFVNPAGGNFQLQTNSPCINAGTNANAPLGADLAGNARIIAGTVDMGAYECQAPELVGCFSWLQGFGLPTTSFAAFMDSDGDGVNNYSEWRADTVPTNALSVLRVISVTHGTGNAAVTWQGVATRSYWLERATNLGDISPFQIIATNVAGIAGLQTYIDATATNGGPNFYRVGVQ